MEFVEPILYIGIAQSFFAGLLIATRRPYTTANRIMTLWVFLLCTELIFALVNRKVLEMYSFPFIAFTYGPLLWLYVRHMTTPSLRISPLNALHFIPFFVFFTVSVIFRGKPVFDNLRGFFVIDRFISLRIIYGVCFFLSVTTYSILSFIEIGRHQNRLKDLVSYTSARITLSWLKVVSASFYTGYLVVFILGGIDIIGGLLPFDPYATVFVFITLFSFTYSFYAIKQPEIFDDHMIMDGDEDVSEDTEAEPQKYARSGLKEPQAHEYLTRLLTFMEVEKPFLDSNLSVEDLSRMTAIPRHYITEVLNEKHGRNFFTFINEYRVDEVIRRMADPKFQHYTILAIAFDSGFNSKSTFNSIFKSYTGKTPTEFRKSLPTQS